MDIKLLMICFCVAIFLSGVIQASAEDSYHWASPAEYEKVTGKKIVKFYEAPMFRELVADGKLAPVEERLPEEPLVLAPVEGGEIGKYGGKRYQASSGGHPLRSSGFGIVAFFQTAVAAEHSWMYNLYPNVIKSWEIHEEGKQWIYHLRKGLKWSDGHPFTADDIMFWWENIFSGDRWFATGTEGGDPWTQTLKASGMFEKMDKLDDYTVKITLTGPSDIPVGVAARRVMVVYPKHYLKQFHPRYRNKDELDKVVREEGFNNWTELIQNKLDSEYMSNIEKPVLFPWIMVNAPPEDPVIYRRNPYFYAVDTEGNQLPYIDEIVHTAALDQEVINLKALAGELDLASIPMSLYPQAKKAEREGKIKAIHWQDTAINAIELNFNHTHSDPEMRAIFRDKRFRIAASHAIDRDLMNETLFFGLSEPWQVAPYEDSPHYHEKLAQQYLEFDLKKANRLLDEVGLDKRDSDGFRLLPSGKRFRINVLTITSSAVPLPQAGELIADNLKAVGLKVNLRDTGSDWSFIIQRRAANDFDAVIFQTSQGTNEGAYFDGHNVSYFLPAHPTTTFWCPLWVEWYLSEGKSGEEPVPAVLEALEYYKNATSTIDFEERRNWFAKVLDIAAENFWTIGTLKYWGNLRIIDAKLGNFVEELKPWDRGGDSGRPDLWYFKE